MRTIQERKYGRFSLISRRFPKRDPHVLEENRCIPPVTLLLPRILIVDDDRDLRITLQRYLAITGYTVLLADGGRHALQMMTDSTIELVITDLIMPDIDGIELIQELRAGHPRVKIIAISGGGLLPPTACLDAARLLGAHACLVKPLSFPVLLQTVRRLLSPVPSFS